MLFGEHATCQAEAEYPELWRGLVGAWSPCLSPRGGTVLRDLSGRQNHGTLTNMDPATDWVTRGGYRALDFDGSNDHIRVPYSVQHDVMDLSLSIWLIGSDVASKGIASRWSVTDKNWLLWDNSNLLFFGGATSAAVSFGSASILDGVTLRHLLVTRSGTTATLYVDGSMYGTPQTAAGVASGASAATQGVNLMSYQDGAFSSSLAGVVFDCTLYNLPIGDKYYKLLYRLGPGGWATTRRRRWNYATLQTAIPYWVFARKNARLIGGGVS